LEQAFQRLERISGVKAPRRQIPYAVAYAAGVVSTGMSMLTGRQPLAPLDGVRMSRKRMWVSGEKARRELGFEPGPVDAAFRRAVDWFRENGYC
jgi:dihydroflavonol-4-reductase